MNGFQNSRYGAIAKALPFTFGKIFFVLSTSDAWTGDVLNDFPVDKDGVPRVYTSLSSAYDAMVTNRNDVCVLDGNTAHTLDAMLDITKSRCHFIGIDYLLGDRRLYGQSTKITLTGAVATDIHMIRNIGIRNSFMGIKFNPANTASETTGGFGEGGEYTIFRNCSFEAAKLSTTAYCDLLLNGDSTQFIDCTFGSTALTVVGDIVRAGILCTAGGVAGGVGSTKDVLFRGCKFLKWAGGTTTTFVTIAANADFTRGFIEFEDCMFIADKRGSTPAVAVAGDTFTNGHVVFSGSTSCVNCTKLATATGMISCLNAKVAATQIGIQLNG